MLLLDYFNAYGPMAREGAGVIQHKIHLRKELHLIILYTLSFVHSVLELTRLVRS